MAMTDPIADMLTRIRNANSAYHEKVEIPASKMKAAVLDILKEEGFVKNYESVNEGKTLKVTLKYGSNKEKFPNRACAYTLARKNSRAFSVVWGSL